MNKVKLIAILVLIGTGLVLKSCRKDPEEMVPVDDNTLGPTPYFLDIPSNFPPMPIPENNPMTQEGVLLGRYLFWEKKMSINNNQSCGSCHNPQFNFSDDGLQFSEGSDPGNFGDRNSMALVNLGWGSFFFWDGRAATLEDQVFGPVVNPLEMNETWPNVEAKLQADPLYPPMFEAAFGTDQIDSVLVSKAIAQFMRTLISGNSKYDKFIRGEIPFSDFTQAEQDGFFLFDLEGGPPPLGQNGADCFHCHNKQDMMFAVNDLRNNGLDSIFTDIGYGDVTGDPNDNGKFKIPSLRNVEFSDPYMHDGRFATLEEVVDHYDSGGLPSATVSEFMKYTDGGLSLPPADKAAIIAFLKTLSDTEFMNNPNFQDPH